MPYFRAKFAVLSSKVWSLVHSVQWWFGKDERFCFSVKCRTCPFLQRLKSVKWIKQQRKNRPQVEEESQKKRQCQTIADCMVIVLKHSLEILNWMNNNRKHFYYAAETGKDVANAGWGILSRSVPSPWRKELTFFNSPLAVWHEGEELRQHAFTNHSLACKQAPSEVGKKFGERSDCNREPVHRLIIDGPGATIQNVSKQHVHS